MTTIFEHGYALLIGVDKSSVEKWSLPDVAKDIKALHEVLVHPDRCAYDPAHVKIIAGEEATKNNILDGFDWLSERLAKDDDATAVVYYSGHGWQDNVEQPPKYYFIPYDIRAKHRRSSALRAGDFADAVNLLQPQRLFVVLDCCHAGGMQVKDLDDEVTSAAAPLDIVGVPAEAQGKALDDTEMQNLQRGTGRAVLTSSTEAQKSYMRRDGKMSVFTYCLIEALTGHAQPQNGAKDVLVSDVLSYVYRRVPKLAEVEASGATQQPNGSVDQTFAVAMLLGGKGLDKGMSPPEPLTELPVAGQQPGVSKHVNTQGGAFVEGNVKVEGGDFVGRDKIVKGDEVRTGNVTAGGNISGSNIVTGSGNTIQTATGSNIAQASGGGTATVNDHSSRSVFDQRGQKVKTQYNIAGDYNPAGVQDRASAVEELRKLIDELGRAQASGVLDEDAATDAEYQVKKALNQAQKPEPDKQTILDYLATANEVITTAAGATALVGAVTQAIQMVQKLF